MSLKKQLLVLGTPCIAAVLLLLYGCDMPAEGPATDPCAGMECLAGQVCVSGGCYYPADPCDLVQCAAGEYCSNGNCLDLEYRPDPACLGVRCPDGFACVGGECYEVSDPCLGACEEDELCYKTVCYPVLPAPEETTRRCPETPCEAHEACYQGTCYPLTVDTGTSPVGLPCIDGACPTGSFCSDGLCYPLTDPRQDPCFANDCKADELCYRGGCYQRVDD